MGKNHKSMYVRFPYGSNDKKRKEVGNQPNPSTFKLRFQINISSNYQFPYWKNQNCQHYGKDSIVEKF